MIAGRVGRGRSALAPRGVGEGEAVGATVAWCQQLLMLPQQAMNITRQSARAGFIDSAAANESYAEVATEYWFSEETQRTMRELVEQLSGK